MEINTDDISIIKKVARFWSHKATRDQDELENVAAAYILDYKETNPKNRNHYIARLCRSAICRFLSEDDISIRIPIVSRKRLDLVDRQRKVYEPEDPQMGPEQYVTLIDSLLAAAETPMEKAYIRLRIDGLTNRQAIAQLDSDKSEVSIMLRAIEKRFEADYYEL